MDKGNIVIGHHADQKQARAQQMRREQTPAEILLWQQLRANRLGGLRFRRQQVLDGFIADFYCHQAGLVIEIDGGIHEKQTDYDALRDRIIAARGLQILRFSNEQVLSQLDVMLAQILAAAYERISSELSA